MVKLQSTIGIYGGDMKEKLKTAIAFAFLGILVLVGFVLVISDRPTDVYPNDDTMIRLYGEAHGSKEYYDIESDLWKECYKDGYRNLFVELPYYSAEFLNLWMKENSDDILDRFFEDIQGTLSGNSYYKEFFRGIKKSCPDTVFYGTDVGHQYDSTGARYLKYLEDNGLGDSENYALAQECIRQGKEYSAVRTETGISPVREAYMISNFIDAYSRCGEGRIMGIYGSYHTELGAPELMAGSLKNHYGDIISSVKLSTLASKTSPYRFGISISGAVFLLMLFVPNIIWAKKKKPDGYDEASKRENKILLLLERIGEVGVTTALLIFKAFDPCIKRLPEGLFINMRIYFWILAFAVMILYECYWTRYFRSAGTMKDFYASFAGFPVAGATLPVIAALLLGIYSQNLIMTGVTIILGIGHIGIHIIHKRENL